MIRINKNILLFSSFIFVWGVFSLLYLYKSFPLISHTIYYCQSVINSLSVPIPYFLNIIPVTLFFLLLVVVVGKLIISITNVWRIRGRLVKNAHSNVRFSPLLTRLGLSQSVCLVKDGKRYAFCLGVRHPKIYVSTGLLSILSPQEMEAVLRHEQYHLENHDTLTMILASISQSLFPFFPLLTDLIATYKIEREIKADKFAVTSVGNASGLISALEKLLSLPTLEGVSLASIADQDTLEPRIHSLVHKRYARTHFSLRHIVVTLSSFFVIVSLAIFPVYAKEIHHQNHDVLMVCTDSGCMNSCTSEKNLTNLYSEIPSSKATTQPPMSQPFTRAF